MCVKDTANLNVGLIVKTLKERSSQQATTTRINISEKKIFENNFRVSSYDVYSKGNVTDKIVNQHLEHLERKSVMIIQALYLSKK